MLWVLKRDNRTTKVDAVSFTKMAAARRLRGAGAAGAARRLSAATAAAEQQTVVSTGVHLEAVSAAHASAVKSVMQAAVLSDALQVRPHLL